MSETPFAPFTPTEPPKDASEAAAAAQAAPAGRRRGRKPGNKKTVTSAPTASPKFDLQTILSAAQVLKEDDFPAFEIIVARLNELGKPARDRILQAVARVFG